MNNEIATQKDKYSEEIESLQNHISHINKTIIENNLILDDKNEIIAHLNEQLLEIKGSRGWKVLWWMWEVRSFFVPKGSYRETILKKARRLSKENPINIFKKTKDWLIGQFSFKMSREAFAFDLFKRSRSSIYTRDLGSLRLPSQDGLVSIVLPVYNGADLIIEALDSVMNQTYKNFELIVINDGSTDNTGKILDEYSKKDTRIRIIHQENMQLPLTLSRGFQETKGEYLTWTSHDNRYKSDFLEKMVACLQRHPSWDMIYANQDIIGEDGAPLRGTDYYQGYQRPPGSEHVYLPKDPAELNTRPNNIIGGAFLYRDRVAYLIGDYSLLRYTREDYDYWMRVNSLMTLRHADFLDPVYEYRFHSDSLTNQDEELGITRDRRNLMVFDDFRRDFYLTPLTWFIEEDISIGYSGKEISKLKSFIENASHVSAQVSQYKDFNLPNLWLPFVYLRITAEPDSTPPVPKTLPPNTIKVILSLSPANNLPKSMDDYWDMRLMLDPGGSPLKLDNKSDWIVSDSIKELFTAIDIRTRSLHLDKIEQKILQSKEYDFKISVIICTHNHQDQIQDTLRSVSQQTMAQVDYEIIVVNNDPFNNKVAPVVEKIRKESFSENPDHLRLVDCPILGLSFARNAGISEAKGEVLYFLDDDAVAAKNILELYWKAFSEHQDAGVIGGHIILSPPETATHFLQEGWKKYWSHFVTDFSTYTIVDKWWNYPWGANWCARREALLRVGGFRCRYGRKGNDFSGGEELIAASVIGKLGYTVAVLPQAKVTHHIEVRRFSLVHIKNTIKAGLFTEYQARVDLYIPRDGSIWKTVKQINKSLSKGLSIFPARHSLNKTRIIETYYYISARGRLLIRQIADGVKRLRKPITRA